MSNCPSVPTLTDKDKTAGLAEALKQLGLQACKTVAAGGGGVSIIPPGFIAGGAAVNIGCEQVEVIGDSIAAMQNNISCIFNEVKASSSVEVSQSNKAVINIKNFSGALHIEQRNYAGTTAISQLSQDQKAHVAAALDSSMKTFFVNLTRNKTGYLGSQQGQKVVESFQKSLSQNNITSSINKAINDFDATFSQTNYLVINIDGYDTFSAQKVPSTIDLTQENINKYQASQLTSSFLSNIFNTRAGADFVDEIKNKITAESEGITTFMFGGVVLLLLILGGLALFGGQGVKQVTKYIIPIAAVAALVVAVIFGLKKRIALSIVSGIIALIFGGLEVLSLRGPAAKL